MSSSASCPCPCDSRQTYVSCCGRWHAGAPAPNAELLMRSRYSAYVLGLSDYLLASWHASTRPATLELAQASPARTSWLGLSVKDHRTIDGEHAEVEFVARYRVGGGRASRLHERSQFVREDGRWFYLDGQIDPAA